jgi:hypothetical protein
MQARSPGELPYALDGIEVWTIGRKERQVEMATVSLQPSRLCARPMVRGVVQDYNGSPSCPFGSFLQVAKKVAKAAGIESHILSPENELPVTKPDCPEIADTLSGWMMVEHGHPILWRDPHSASGTVLLKMNLVARPEVNAGVSKQGSEFFFASVVAPGQHGQSESVACVSEIPTGGRFSGIVAPRFLFRISLRRRLTTSCRPRDSHQARSLPVVAARLDPQSPTALCRVERADQVDPDRSKRIGHLPRTGAPSTRHFSENRPAAVPFPGQKGPGPRAIQHVTGDRTLIPSCDESRPAESSQPFPVHLSVVASCHQIYHTR